MDDGVNLHQQVVRLHSLAEEQDPAASLITPSKSQTSKVRSEIKEATEGLFKRTSAKLKLPDIPAVFRWELVGHATKWALEIYQKPRSPAALELLDSVIDLAADVLGSKDIASVEDQQLAARLANATRLHQMARHYIDQAGAPPAAAKLVNAVGEAMEGKGPLDPSATAQIMIDVANQTAGPALAELLAYMKSAGEGKTHMDMAHVIDLYVPVLAQFGAPPSIAEYFRTTSDYARRQIVPDQTQEMVRLEHTLAQASRELGMPSAIPETLEYIAEVIGKANQTHIFEKPDEMKTMYADLNDLSAKLYDQLGLPEAVSKLVRRLSAPLRSQSVPGTADAAEILSLLAEASRQLSFPSAVAEFYEYVGSLTAKGSTPEPERLQDLLVQLSEQVGAPQALGKFGKDLATLAKKSGGQPDPAKVVKMVTQLIRKLGMPAFADIFGKVGGPLITKGKAPDALALAMLGPSLMKVLPDIETANGIAVDMLKKLVSPLLPVYDHAVEKLTGNMPHSTLKSGFTHMLSLARPAA